MRDRLADLGLDRVQIALDWTILVKLLIESRGSRFADVWSVARAILQAGLSDILFLMMKPKIARASVALRPPVQLLADIDAEAARTGSSRHSVMLALIVYGLAARKALAAPGAATGKRARSMSGQGARSALSVLTKPPQPLAQHPPAAAKPHQQAVQPGRSEVLPGSRLKKT